MKLLMVTNTYLPMVGGVARSVQQFTKAYRAKGHDVMIVAPTFRDQPDSDADEADVVRVPAIQNFNGSDFSVRLPIPGLLMGQIDAFEPDLVHSHHPFLLGDTALRIAARRSLPLVFTHHTLYEQYSHYVPGDSPPLKDFAVRLATEYANLAQQVIAPSQSIADLLRDRGVCTPIEPIPTGVHCDQYAQGDGAAIRKQLGIGPHALVIGHVGRLAPEKNLPVLAEAVARAIEPQSQVVFLVVGDGPSSPDIQRIFDKRGLSDRLFLAGQRTGQDLVNCYHAMDLFGFASMSETQGMVLAEAMAAGLPVAALDASGVREIVDDGRNGRLVPNESSDALGDAIGQMVTMQPEARQAMAEHARQTAEQFDTERCAQQALQLYSRMLESHIQPADPHPDPWEQLLSSIETEWNLWSGRVGAALDTLSQSATTRAKMNDSL